MGNPVDLLAPVWSHMTQVQPVRGEGVYLYDAAGQRYTDFTSGIGVTNTGHCHPRVVQAIQEQATHLIFGQMNIVVPPTTVALAEKLNEVTPAQLSTGSSSPTAGRRRSRPRSSWRAWRRTAAT